MMLKQTVLAVAIVLSPLTAFASGSLDVFYVDQNISAFGPDDDGDGIGFRGQADLGRGVSLTALYQDADLDNANANLRETRIGLSYDTSTQGINVGAGLDNVSVDLNQGGPGNALRGYSVNAHASVSPIDKVNAYARVAYTDLDELNGMEYEVGASYAINKEVAGFVEYRMANLNDRGLGNDVDLDTLRVGARYTF